MRRFLLFTPLVLILLVVVAGGVVYLLLQNENFVKSQLHSQLLKYTGRELTVNGPAQLTLGRITRLEARDVHFSNADWADEPDMASAGYVVISIDLSTLFDDRIVFPEAALDDCKILVLRNDEDELNWDLGAGDDSEPVPAPEPESEAKEPDYPPVKFKDLRVSSCNAHIDSLKLEEPLDIEVDSLAMQQLDNGRWQSKASGSVNKMPLSIDGWLFPAHALFLGGRIDHDLKADLGDIELQSSGSIQDAKTGAGANLTTRFRGPEIETLLEEFKLPPFSEGEFDYRLKLNTEGGMTRLDLDGDLGSIDIKADGELDRLIRPTRGHVKVSVDGPNLGALARVFGIEGLVEKAFTHVSNAEFGEDAIKIHQAALKTENDHLKIGGKFSTAPNFAGTELDVSFRTDQAGNWTTVFGQPQQDLGPIDIGGKLMVGPEGVLSLDARAEQETTSLQVNGNVGKLPDSIEPDLNIDFQSTDPSHLAAVVGMKQIPAAPLAITGRIGLSGKQLELSKVKIILAGDQADIDGLVIFEQRYAGSRLDVGVDVKNIGNLGRLFGEEDLPEQPLRLSATLVPEHNGLAFKVHDSNLGQLQLDLEGRIPDLEQPMAMDADFDIRLPKLSDLSIFFPETALPSAPFTAKGKLEARDERVHLQNVFLDLEGNRARINGQLALAERFAGSDLTFDLDIKSLGSLAGMFGQEGLPDEPMKMTANVKPEGKGLAFRLEDGNLRDVQVEIQGRIADLDQPTGIDADFDIQLPRLSEISFLFPGRDLPNMPFSAKGRLVNQKTKTQFRQVGIHLGKLDASVDGSLFPDNRFDLSIQASGPDASRLGQVIGTSLPAKPFSLSTALSGHPNEFELAGLDVTLGDSKAQGDLKIGLGDVTSIEGRAESPRLDISHWYPGEQQDEDPQIQSSEPAREWMFGDTPVAVLKDLKQRINLDIQVDELILGNTTAYDIKMGLLLSERLLEINPFTLRGDLGGRYNGQFKLDGRAGTPKMNLNASGNDVRIGLVAAPGQDPTTYPPFDIDGFLEGEGATQRELASSLNGSYRAYVGSGQIANAGMDVLFSDFLTQLVTTLNPFHESSEYQNIDCAVFSADAKDGVVSLMPMIVQTEKITIISDGAVDLNSENIDLTFQTKARQGLGISAGALIHPMIKVGGRLTSPAVEMDAGGAVVSGGLAVATIGISVLAKSVSDRFLSSPDPCGDARKQIEMNAAITK